MASLSHGTKNNDIHSCGKKEVSAGLPKRGGIGVPGASEAIPCEGITGVERRLRRIGTEATFS